MRVVNRVFLIFVGLIAAFILPMFQVHAEEDQDDTVRTYVVSQKHYIDGVLDSDVTYYFNCNVDAFYCCAPNSQYLDYGQLSLRYWSDKSQTSSVVIVNSDSYMRSNLPPYTERDFSGLRNPTVTLNYGQYVASDGKLHSYTYDVGDMMIFSDSDAAEAYFIDGDTSGWLNRPEPEEFSYFSLTGFNYDNSVFASWSGVSTDLEIIKNNVDDVEVVVSPSFFLILEPGEQYEEFIQPESIIVPLSGNFSKSYDSFFEGNPYKGRALLTLSFYPRYYDTVIGNMYRGSSISMKFDSEGNITDVDIPESSFEAVYDPGCYFDSPASTTIDVSGSLWKTFFRWNKVVTSYVYKTNYVAVDIGYEGKWYSYSTDAFFSSNSISLTFAQASTFMKDLDPDSNLFGGYKIRYTPYYKTSSGLYYGKPIIVSVSEDGKSESITEIDGDFQDDQQKYNFVDKTPYDWFEDTTLWDNVDQIVDNIEDDMDGTVDLDNLSFNFFKMLKNVISACGELPTLVNVVFSFLPGDISKLLVISLSLIIILRILGR